MEGLSTVDTAAALGVSEDVVKTHLSRARTSLRRSLLERAGASAPDVFRFYRARCDRVVANVLAQVTSMIDDLIIDVSIDASMIRIIHRCTDTSMDPLMITSSFIDHRW